jgi:thymidine kinase
VNFEQYAEREAQDRLRRIGERGGGVKVLVGPASSSKTGLLWLEWFAMGNDTLGVGPKRQAFHYARIGDDREAELELLIGALRLKAQHGEGAGGARSRREAVLDARNAGLLVKLYDGRMQSITNAPLKRSDGVQSTAAIMRAISPETEVVFIDDAHLLGDGLTDLCRGLAGRGVNVLVAAWKLDPGGAPYDEIGRLLCEADEVVTCHGRCAGSECRSDDPPATYTQRETDGRFVGPDVAPLHSSATTLRIRREEPNPAEISPVQRDKLYPVCRQHFETPLPVGMGQLPLIGSFARVPRASLTVICGPMFSGKTRELLFRVEQETHLRNRVAVCKAIADAESASGQETMIGTHTAQRVEGRLSVHAIPIRTGAELIASNAVRAASVVIIDRAQFLPGLGSACDRLLRDGKRLIVSGIDQTFAGEPFGEMPQLLCMADWILKLNGVCHKCASPRGSRTQRFVGGDREVPAPRSSPTTLIGHEEAYETRCRHCHVVPD